MRACNVHVLLLSKASFLTYVIDKEPILRHYLNVEYSSIHVQNLYNMHTYVQENS